MFSLQSSRLLTLGDGEPHERVTHAVQFQLSMGSSDTPHTGFVVAYVADLQYNLFLRRPWLTTHVPQIRWEEGIVVLKSDHCHQDCGVQALQCASYYPLDIIVTRIESSLRRRGSMSPA